MEFPEIYSLGFVILLILLGMKFYFINLNNLSTCRITCRCCHRVFDGVSNMSERLCA